ncbi:MAG TPA: hypothetical protein VGO62_15745, partial [Myxococcota bacterium]
MLPLARSLVVVALVGGGVVGGAGCAHVDASAPDVLSQRRLLVLERDFAEFSARSLTSAEDIEQQT